MSKDFDEEKQNKQLEELHQEEEEKLVEMLAKTKYNLPYANLQKVGVDNEALRQIPEDEAREQKIAPFKLVAKNIYIAVRSPLPELMEKLKEDLARKGYKAVFYMASIESIEKVWERYVELSMAENALRGGLEISAEVLRETAKNIHTMTDIEKLMKDVEADNRVHKVSRILEIILAGAIAIKASDIHIECEKDRARLRLRLDGVLQDVQFFELELYNLLNSRIKLLSGMKLTSNSAQDGRFAIIEGTDEISIRTSLVPGAYGEKIVMRILDPKSIQITLEELGIEEYLFKAIDAEIAKPNGLILVTGPTGSGKTTSLYAFLARIYTTEINIITIEDPIEYHLKGITQTQVEEEKNYTFLNGLRAAMRQDPDVIMVGEIRDHETAETAVQAALTGHLVLSTLHTNNAAGVIPRLIDLGVNPKILVSALSMSIAQRLVRKLCQFCKKEKVLTEEEQNKLREILQTIKDEGKDSKKYGIDETAPFKVFEAVGCDKCNKTGYKGRMGIFEAILTDEKIEKIIPNNPSEREIKQVAKTQGILSMRQDGVVKILTGVTSIPEVQSVVDLNEE